MGKASYNAIKSLNIVRETFRKQGKMNLVNNYYGMAIDYISCQEEFYKCVEAASGSKLFNFVMKDVKTVKAYIDQLNKQNLPGTPQMLPLETLVDADYDYPEVYDEHDEIAAFPLIERIEVSRQDFVVVAKHIFGRYMVTVDSMYSNKIAKEYNLSCVTLDGDTTSSKGVISGGYRDQTKSRLKIYQEIHRTDEKVLNDLIQQHSNLKKEKRSLDEETNKLQQDIAEKEQSVYKFRELIDRSNHQETMFRKDLKNKNFNLQENKKAIENYEESLVILKTQRDSMINEKNTPIEGGTQLSQNEVNQLHQINQEVSEKKRELIEIQNTRRNLERKKNAIQHNLSDNLQKRRDQLIKETDDITMAERQQTLAATRADLMTASKELEYVETRLSDLTNELNTARDEDQKIRSKLEEYQNKEKEAAYKIEEDQKKLVKITTKQQTLSQKQDELETKITEIGPIAQDIVAKYRGISSKNLYQKLHTAITGLQKYSHVNKKALDQYLTSSEERRSLEARSDEIVKGKQAIQDMMDVLEEKKYNQITFTFMQISKYFKEVFGKLVPGGTMNV